MSRRPYNWQQAVRHLQASCDHLAGFIEDFGAARLVVRGESNLFRSLARSIAYQQLSAKAAGTIYGRFEALFPEAIPTAEIALGLPVEALRGAGLSQAKSLAIIDLAEKTRAGELPSRRAMGRMSDAEIVTALCMVRGIGPWTAQMHLIFNLGRPDVMPANDLAIQKGVQNVYHLRQLPTPDRVLKKTRHLRPFRSVASWYFWRASELPG